MLYVVLRPMPSPTKYRMSKVVALAYTRQEALTKREENGDELWIVHKAQWVRVRLDEAPAINGQLALF